MDGLAMWKETVTEARAAIGLWRREADALEQTVNDLTRYGCGIEPYKGPSSPEVPPGY